MEIVHGPAFTETLTGTIDDALGLVSAIDGVTEQTDVGDDAYVLLARGRFGSVGDDQVPVVPEDCFLGPYDMQMSLAEGQTQLVGAGSVASELGGAPDTELWAVMYDFGRQGTTPIIQEDNLIDFGDFSLFAPAFGKFVGSAQPPYVCWADFDRSGRVDFGDLAFFAPNFGKTRAGVQSGDQTLVFPANFPDAWRAVSGDDGAVGAGELGGGEGEAMDAYEGRTRSTAGTGILAGLASLRRAHEHQAEAVSAPNVLRSASSKILQPNTVIGSELKGMKVVSPFPPAIEQDLRPARLERTGVKEDKNEYRWTDPGDPLDEILTLLAEAWSTRYRTQNQSL